MFSFSSYSHLDECTSSFLHFLHLVYLIAIFRRVEKTFVLHSPWSSAGELSCSQSPQALAGSVRVGLSASTGSAMPTSVTVFPCVCHRKLLPWLLRQPRRMAPSRSRGSLGPPFSSPLCSMPAALPRAGRRSQLCSPVWVLPPCCPSVRQSSSIRAPLSLCWPLHSSDSLRSSSHRSTGSKMSSSSSSFSSSTSSSSTNNNNDGQGKPKPKSPFRKRGSLQSTTSPGE